MSCPCGLEKPYEGCCGRFLDGQAFPATAEELMRSRYVAFTQENWDYLESTQVEPLKRPKPGEAQPEWTGLTVISAEAGGPEDERGTVEFSAHYHLNGCCDLHEKSNFVRREGRWVYHSGDFYSGGTQRRKVPKVGRNEPCPCGSGKKFKKCCG